MLRISELAELAKQCYALANGTLHLETQKKALRDIGAKYEQLADELRRIEITRAVFPKRQKVDKPRQCGPFRHIEHTGAMSVIDAMDGPSTGT